ncbi:Diacylglycerol kinase-related protein [Labilithrix luteola]|uniref:Diacylglycerol kinase-related protein n=1 Tax=Labilithrix luteola TaxID=1391654 RepID=A0A0K1PVR0_9BACT|nr:diacylglycerol kinase family protein [Labilithrix luteola]AKU97618.1 Diacylglycerol kinase-related protein [Labilithrix luteola]
MRALLIHNATAGGSSHPPEALMAALKRAGFDVRYMPARGKKDGKKKADVLVEERIDLVVAAGGDGTIARTVRAIAGQPIPLAIAPLGTANNVARSLGLYGDPLDQLVRLGRPVRRKLDIGIAGGAWGEWRFVEAAGVGLFQHVLEHDASSKDKALDKARALLLARLETGRISRPWELSLDGEMLADDFVLFEAMIMRSIGPRLRFAPTADPFDGFFDVVMVRERDKTKLQRYLRALLAGDEGATPDIETRRARHVHVRLSGASVRIDDNVLPEEGEPRSEHGDFRIMPGAVELWLPS